MLDADAARIRQVVTCPECSGETRTQWGACEHCHVEFPTRAPARAQSLDGQPGRLLKIGTLHFLLGALLVGHLPTDDTTLFLGVLVLGLGLVVLAVGLLQAVSR